MRRDAGFVAIEWLLATALLLFPVVVVAAAVPTWIERQHAATVVAREVAVYAAETFPASSATSREIADVIAANYGIPPGDVDVTVLDDAVRGGQVRARVAIVMPAISIPFGGTVGRWRYSTEYTVRIDDYRSRT